MSRAETIAQLLNLPGDAIAKDLLDEATVIAQLGRAAGHSGCDAELAQWINFGRNEKAKAHLAFLNSFLADKSYLVGEFFTVADVCVLQKLHGDEAVQEAIQLGHIRRWLSHVQTQVKNGILPEVTFPETKLPLLIFSNATVSAAAPVSSAATAATAAEASLPTPPAAAPVEVAAAEDKKKNKDAEKKKNKEDKGGESAGSSSAAAATSSAATASAEVVDPSKLDIRVGLVVKCWNHPDSDKLLCEEIDLGEGSNRMIASGIRAFYAAEEVQGRKVLVLANLKERSIAGFKSQGMVLCASNADKSAVKLLDVPENATVGQRVLFAGSENGEAATPAQMAKKKIFETLAPLMRTDGRGVVHCGSAAFTLNDVSVTAPLNDAVVS